MKWRSSCAFVALILVAQGAQAQSVGYEEALRAARVEQPVLQARELEVEALRNAAEAADELPDPRLRAGIVNLPVTGPAAFDLDRQLPTQVQVGVEQEIPNLAKRRARAGLAVSDIRLAEARLGVVGRDVEVAAGRAWISLAYAQQRLALAVEAQDELRELVPVARSAVASGSARPAESLEIRRALLEIDDARTRIEADREAAQARLTRYIAGEEPVAQGPVPPADVDPVELRTTLESNPGIRLADTAEQRARAAIDLARAETLPIFAGRRQEPRIAAAEAQAAAALAERADELRELEAQFAADLAAWRSAARQWQRAREELLPLARDRADLEMASFAAGRADLIDVIEARTALALLELEILEREEATVEAAATLRLTYREHMQ
jgi:outer membrane protein TolC